MPARIDRMKKSRAEKRPSSSTGTSEAGLSELMTQVYGVLSGQLFNCSQDSQLPITWCLGYSKKKERQISDFREWISEINRMFIINN